MGKDAYNISASATVLHEAQKAVRANPSSAEDALSADRTAKHFCQYVNNHACMELEATQAAALVLGIDSYGGSDDLDYHSAWDTIKVAAYAAGSKLNKLKEEPGMADCDAPLEDESDPCRAICSNGRPCRNQVHRNAGTDGHCPFTCELHKHLRVEELQEGGADELADSDGEVVVSDSDGEDDDLLARGNVDAEAAAGVADDTGPRAATRRPQRDLLARGSTRDFVTRMNEGVGRAAANEAVQHQLNTRLISLIDGRTQSWIAYRPWQEVNDMEEQAKNLCDHLPSLQAVGGRGRAA